MWKKIFIAAIIVASNFGLVTTSEAVQADYESYCSRDSYCGEYDDRNCDSGYCNYGKGRGCC